MVAAAEIEGAHGLLMYTATISTELQCVVASAKARPTCKNITLKYAAYYFCAVMKRVNVSEETHDKQRDNIRTLLIKVSTLSNNRAKMRDPSLAWIISCSTR